MTTVAEGIPIETEDLIIFDSESGGNYQ